MKAEVDIQKRVLPYKLGYCRIMNEIIAVSLCIPRGSIKDTPLIVKPYKRTRVLTEVST